MLLSAMFLVDVGGVNHYKEVSSIHMTEGDTLDVYLQLRDLSVNSPLEGYNPAGRRFIPLAGATLQAIIDNLDNGKKIVKICSQPFSQDPSIWRFTISASDTSVRGTVNLKLQLTEGARITRGLIQPAIHVADLTGLSK